MGLWKDGRGRGGRVLNGFMGGWKR